VSSLDGNLSSLYLQLGRIDAAIDSVKRALAHDTAVDLNGRRARLLILLASLIAQGGKTDDARQLFHEGIVEAIDLTIRNCDRMAGTAGYELLLRKPSAEAEEALLERLQDPQANHLPSLAVSHRNLGMLRLEQGDCARRRRCWTPLWWTPKTAGRIPQWNFYHARGRLRLSEGSSWRRMPTFNWPWSLPQLPPDRAGQRCDSSEHGGPAARGLRIVYRHRNSPLFDTGRSELARDTFEAVEENRAGSLSARLSERRNSTAV